MKRIYFKMLLATVFYVVSSTIMSCKHGCGGEGGISSSGSTESHNMGLNCMNCHAGTGEGQGCFEVGGTIFHADMQSLYGNCRVDLYTEPDGQGTLVSSITADGKGNVYSGKDIVWGKGLFPKVTSPDGKSETMLEPISKGACNSCHGMNTDRIFVN
jgi:hypothetical protein